MLQRPSRKLLPLVPPMLPLTFKSLTSFLVLENYPLLPHITNSSKTYPVFLLLSPPPPKKRRRKRKKKEKERRISKKYHFIKSRNGCKVQVKYVFVFVQCKSERYSCLYLLSDSGRGGSGGGKWKILGVGQNWRI